MQTNRLRRFVAVWRELARKFGPSELSPQPARIQGLEPRINFDHGPPDLLPDLTPWTSQEKGFVYGWRIDRTEEPGHVLLRLTTAVANVGDGPLELRGGRGDKVTGQEVFQRIYDQLGGVYDRYAGRFSYHSAHDHTHLDDFAEYRLRNITADGGVGKVIARGRKVSFCLLDIEAYDVTLPGSPQGGNYDTCNTERQGLSVGWSDVYDYDLPDQWIDITHVSPGRYWLEVVVDPDNHIRETNDNNNTTRIAIKLKGKPAPRNDSFNNRTLVSGSNLVTRGSNARGTLESGEPRHAGVEGGASVWWSWKANFSGEVIMHTRRTKFDSILGVYQGTRMSRLRKVAANDDMAPGKAASWVSFRVKAGQTYQIAVDGFRGASGSIWLTIKQAT